MTLEEVHTLANLARGLASRDCVAIVHQLYPGPVRLAKLRDACGLWAGAWEFAFEALRRGRLVDVERNMVFLTPTGRRAFDGLRAALPESPGRAAPRDKY